MRLIVVKYVFMYKIGKMRHVETIPGVQQGVIKKNDRGGEFN
jgi:hypothetical protein